MIVAALMGRAVGDEYPTPYWDRLESMAEFMAWVTDCHGHTPHVGDDDGGKAVVLSQATGSPVRSMMTSAAALWRRDEFRTWAGGPRDEKTAWLIGDWEQVRERDDNRAPVTGVMPAAPRGSRCFRDGGYVVLRHGADSNDEVVVVLDVGDLGWPDAAAHGHADALAVLLHIAGQPMFVDPGTYSYEESTWRHYFRATAQHNTLCFAEEDQSQYVNRFIWGKRAQARLLDAKLDGVPQLVEGEVVWSRGARHRRRIVFLPDEARMLIKDVWDGPVPAVIRFCLPPGVTSNVAGQAVTVDTGHVELRIANDVAPVALELYDVSERCYHRQPAKRVVVQLPEPAGRCVTTVGWCIKSSG
jgi:hypothetical protein